MKTTLVPLDAAWLDAYYRFAKRAFGPYAYQASANYIDWLYAENPSVHKRPEDCWVVTTEDHAIVGCMHKLRQPWRIQESITDIPALHNHYVEEAYRQGTGLHLLLKSLSKEAGVIAPGCEPKVGDIYRKMGRYTQIEGHWFRQVLRPIHTALKMGWEKGWPQPASVIPLSRPNTTLLNQILDSYHHHTQDYPIKQHYDLTWLTWRFFHPKGPQHLVVYKPNPSGIIDFMILSVGHHKGVRLARIVETGFEPKAFPALFKTVWQALGQHNVDVLTTFTTDYTLISGLQNQGLRPLSRPPQTFVYLANKTPLDGLRLCGAAGDFGLDALIRT